jgi:hypothetical protein
MISAESYDRARLRNRSRDPVLSTRGFDCATCGTHHQEAPLDFAFDAPLYYHQLAPDQRASKGRITSDLCVIEDQDYFIRGCLEIPILDVPATFVWGIWTSLSKKSYDRVLELWDSDESLHEEPYFGWLSNSIPGYPETLSLKTEVHSRGKRKRPYVELEPTDHPLAVEQWEGITLERALAIAEMAMHSTRS